MQDSFYCNYLASLEPNPMNKVPFNYETDYPKNGRFEEFYDDENCEQEAEPNLEISFMRDSKPKVEEEFMMSEEKGGLDGLEDSEDDDSIIIKNFGEQTFDDFCTKENSLLLEHGDHDKKIGPVLTDVINKEKKYESLSPEESINESQSFSNKDGNKEEKVQIKIAKENKYKTGKRHSRRTLHPHSLDPMDNDMLSYSTGKPLKRSYTKKSGYKSYNELLALMQSLLKSNWTDTDRSSTKLLSSKVLNPNAFWFLACANYFPRNAFAHKNNKEFVHHRLEKLKNLVPDIPQRLDKATTKPEAIQRSTLTQNEIEELNILSRSIKAWIDSSRTNEYFEKTMGARTINLIPKPNYTSKDDEWISEIRTFICESQRDLQGQGFAEASGDPSEKIDLYSKLDLQDLISLYEKNLYQQTVETEHKLEKLEENIFNGLFEEDMIHKLNFEPNDSLVDLKMRFPEEEQYLCSLEKKHTEAREVARKNTDLDVPHMGLGKGHGKTVKTHVRMASVNLSEEYMCQICNDSSLNDDDLIVYCSACNLSVHQSCYGIVSIPHDDWICEGCLNFGASAKHLRCPFCNIRGGAMKQTLLKADTNVFKHSNPNYHAFLKSYVSNKTSRGSSNSYQRKIKAMTPEFSDASKSQIDAKENFELRMEIEDNSTKSSCCIDLIEDEPKPRYVWAHVTCALFLPELYFKDSVKVTNIAGAETISKERFHQKCEACGTSGTGAVINCAKAGCKRVFHAECARKEKYYLDMRDNGQSQIIYQIYCDKHIPLQMRRTLETREKQTKEAIESFFKNVEKYLLTVPVEPKTPALVVNSTTPFPQEDKSFIKKKKKHHFKDDMEHFMKQIEKFKELQAKTIQGPLNITLEKVQNEENIELYKIVDAIPTKPIVRKEHKIRANDDLWVMMPYKNLTPEQKFKKYRKYLAQIKGKGDKNLNHLNGHKENIRQTSSKTSQASNTTYCICQRPYKGELMIACEKCGEWYHPECVGLKSKKNLDQMNWNCSKCREGKDLSGRNVLNGDLLKRPNRYNLDEEEEDALLSKKLKVEKRINTRSNRG